MSTLREAALNADRVSGLTHKFYKYPARFSPVFARTAIKLFTQPGDLVLDPFMGGGTTPVEALASGRQVIGADLNELSVFVASAKTNPLSAADCHIMREWAIKIVPRLSCRYETREEPPPVRNMHLPTTRWIKKTISILLESIDDNFKTPEANKFARCAVLQAGQWALSSRKNNPTANAFRARVSIATLEMLTGLAELRSTDFAVNKEKNRSALVCADAEVLGEHQVFKNGDLADLVVTSPPYPGVHILYHRWQVDGRKETDIAYWIANCRDGRGTSFYNFEDRRQDSDNRYFQKASRVYSSLRNCVKDGARVIQMLSFSEPSRQLPRFLRMMNKAGFVEDRRSGERRIWRPVPNRAWHATNQGRIGSSREVVLVHQAS